MLNWLATMLPPLLIHENFAPGEGTSMVIYTGENTNSEKVEVTWRIDEDALVGRPGRGLETRYRWASVTSVRLTWAASIATLKRHVTILKFRDGGKVLFDNLNFAGPAGYKDQSSAYTPFVREVLSKVAEHAPKAKARQGATVAGFVGLMVLVLLVCMVLALAALMLMLQGERVDPMRALGRVWPVAIAAPVMIVWTVRAWPRKFNLSQLPSCALP